jgi:hypothetical protein
MLDDILMIVPSLAGKQPRRMQLGRALQGSDQSCKFCLNRVDRRRPDTDKHAEVLTMSPDFVWPFVSVAADAYHQP